MLGKGCTVLVYFGFFFFKQKTADEMRISDWSSDVCSSDLHEDVGLAPEDALGHARGAARVEDVEVVGAPLNVGPLGAGGGEGVLVPDGARQEIGARAVEIGRASCRERVCRYVKISVVAVSF